MGLSNEQAKNNVTSAQVLVELLQGLKTLNGGQLDKLAKDAYALPEAEQRKADEARASIAKYQDLLAQHKKQAADIEASQDNLDLRSAQIKDALVAIETQKKDLAAKQKALDTDKAMHLLNVDKFTKDQAELKKGQDKLASDKQAQDDKEKALETEKAALKDKSDKLKSLIG